MAKYFEICVLIAVTFLTVAESDYDPSIEGQIKAINADFAAQLIWGNTKGPTAALNSHPKGTTLGCPAYSFVKFLRATFGNREINTNRHGWNGADCNQRNVSAHNIIAPQCSGKWAYACWIRPTESNFCHATIFFNCVYY